MATKPLLKKPSRGSTNRSLTRRWSGGVAVLSLVTLGRYGLNFGTQIVLARWLLREHFGDFALALTVVTGMTALSSLHADRFLVKREEWTREGFDVAFTLEWLTGAAAAALTWFVVPVILEAMDRGAITSYVRVLALMIIVDPLVQTLRSRLQRDLHYAKMWWPTLGGVAVGSTVAIVSAVQGLGVWALVLGRLASSLFEGGLLLAALRQYPRIRWDRALAAEMVRFGGPLLGSAFMVFLYWHMDYLIVDRCLGPVALGCYFMAFQLTQHLLHLRTGLAHIGYPILARQDDHDRGETFRKLTWINAALYAYLAAMVLAVGEPLVLQVLGEKWAASIVPLQWLMVLTAWRGVIGHVESVLLLSDGGGVLLRLTLVNGFVLPIFTIPLTLMWGIEGTAIGVLASTATVAPYLLKAIGARVHGGAQVLTQMKGPCLASVLAVLFVLGWRAHDEPNVLVAACAGTLIYGVLLAIFDRERVSACFVERGRWLPEGKT